MTTNLTTKWKTIAIVGYRAAVSRDENRAAHGGACLLQARIGRSGMLGRKVNSNGRHSEAGEAFALNEATMSHWMDLGR